MSKVPNQVYYVYSLDSVRTLPDEIELDELSTFATEKEAVESALDDVHDNSTISVFKVTIELVKTSSPQVRTWKNNK
jgi:hypothetical protein